MAFRISLLKHLKFQAEKITLFLACFVETGVLFENQTFNSHVSLSIRSKDR
jgi:hypothetical protein